jgi:hypothetical protein
VKWKQHKERESIKKKKVFEDEEVNKHPYKPSISPLRIREKELERSQFERELSN